MKKVCIIKPYDDVHDHYTKPSIYNMGIKRHFVLVQHDGTKYQIRFNPSFDRTRCFWVTRDLLTKNEHILDENTTMKEIEELINFYML